MLVLILLFFSSVCFAGEYVLVKGKGVDVCETYKSNLNSFNLYNPYVMACERKINPKFADLKKPEWEELELSEHVELIKKIELFLGNYVVTSDNVEGWEEYIKGLIKDERISIELSQIDINNDGKKENVIKYLHGACLANYYGAALMVLNGNEDDIDIEKTKPLFQNPPSASCRLPSGPCHLIKNRPFSAGWDNTMYDVFIYKNKVYFDRWRNIDLSPDYRKIIKTHKLIKVFITEPDKAGNGKTTEICRLKFTTTK